MAMAQTQIIPPVNIPIPTKIGSKMGGPQNGIPLVLTPGHSLQVFAFHHRCHNSRTKSIHAGGRQGQPSQTGLWEMESTSEIQPKRAFQRLTANTKRRLPCITEVGINPLISQPCCQTIHQFQRDIQKRKWKGVPASIAVKRKSDSGGIDKATLLKAVPIAWPE